MRKVIGIGETVLDIIFKNEQPIGAVPGGSVFNGIISLGRSGIKSSFISEAGHDRVGKNIIKFLKDNNVNADEIHVYPESKSPISLAFLDNNNEAEYLFYKDHGHDQLDFIYPEVNPDDINADDPLFSEGLGLDSIDALELIVMMEKYYGIKLQDASESKAIFKSIRTMAEYIANHRTK